jgi:hypothetical protein
VGSDRIKLAGKCRLLDSAISSSRELVPVDRTKGDPLNFRISDTTASLTILAIISAAYVNKMHGNKANIKY